jgi:hypothetical protein
MISETTFATGYASFWRGVIPNSEKVIRRLNLNRERFARSIQGAAIPERRAYINELGVRLFTRLHGDASSDEYDPSQLRLEIASETRMYLSQFEDMGQPQLVDPVEDEWDEAEKLSSSLGKLVDGLNQNNQKIIKSPKFRGCGFVDACAGDLLIGDELIEIKAGDRAFRSTDIKQLLVYCALNSSYEQFQIRQVGCANPRRGTFFSIDLNMLSLELASKPAAELLFEIVYFISSGDISR